MSGPQSSGRRTRAAARLLAGISRVAGGLLAAGFLATWVAAQQQEPRSPVTPEELAGTWEHEDGRRRLVFFLEEKHLRALFYGAEPGPAGSPCYFALEVEQLRLGPGASISFVVPEHGGFAPADGDAATAGHRAELPPRRLTAAVRLTGKVTDDAITLLCGAGPEACLEPSTTLDRQQPVPTPGPATHRRH
ncbi:MAG: hypothetical protein HYV63_15135 [Candidatus Schekmanbacteria bacterium]|nr:hypothetical protein [Candidatus Schekmanbacteria bacterium]